jgi:proline iminopeptidase
VVYYDQRGCGRSDYKPGPGYTVDQAVEDLDKLRAALKIDRWVVLGWSYGGVLAQLYTVRHPEHTAGLVLVGSTDDGCHLKLQRTRQYDYMSPEERKRIGEIYRDRSLPQDKLVYNIHLNGDWKRQNFYRPAKEELARMARYGWKHDPVFRSSICRQLGELDVRGFFDGCPVPTLVLEGKYDLTWGTDKAEKFQACHPGSQLVMFERSAHGPFIDEPERFFSVLAQFIKALPAEDTAGIAKWRKSVADLRATRAAEAAHVADSVGFRTKKPAPPEFDAWAFFWVQPAVPEGSRISYEVRSGQGDEYFRWGPHPAHLGVRCRSDFSKGQADPSKLHGKEIVVKFWTSQGKIEFPPDSTVTFEFYKDGKTIKRIPGIAKDR